MALPLHRPSAAMTRLFVTISLALLAASLPAQTWSASLATGPFVFGDFAETEERLGLPGGNTEVVVHTLSADTRAGAAAGIERHFNDRLSLRFDATWTEAPLAVKTGGGDDAVSIDIADLRVITFALPLVFRFNSGGSFRPLIYLGPALAMYDVDPNVASGVVPIFRGRREKWGGIAGAGLEWWWNEDFGLRGSVSDLITPSPLERSDFTGPTPGSLEIRDVQNIHTTVGIAYRW